MNKVARALGLEYYALRQRVDTEPAKAERAPGFVEVTLAAPARMPSCRVELEDGGSTRLKIELQGLSAEELGTVVRSIWSAAR